MKQKDFDNKVQKILEEFEKTFVKDEEMDKFRVGIFMVWFDEGFHCEYVKIRESPIKDDC